MTPSSAAKSLAAFGAAAALALADQPARADDVAGALDELKQGYALKQTDQCAQAVRHFERSFQLHATAKALLNLSDCEQRLGDFLTARQHVTEGLALAENDADASLATVARDQAALVDRKLAWLTVRFPEAALAGCGDCAVRRDAATLGRSAFGVPVALNPGLHDVVVESAQHARRLYAVRLAEGEHAELEVAPGAALAHPVPLSVIVPVATALAVSAVGLTVGIATGLAASSKHGALTGECPAGACPDSARDDLDAFRSLRDWSTGGYVVASAGLAVGAALWFALPRGRVGSSSGARAWIGPASAGLAGSF